MVELGGDDLAGQENVLLGVPEEARLPVVWVLEMLGKFSGRIPRSSQECLDKKKLKIILMMVINIPPIRPRTLLLAALSVVAKGMSSLLVIPKAWARFIQATFI